MEADEHAMAVRSRAGIGRVDPSVRLVEPQDRSEMAVGVGGLDGDAGSQCCHG